MEFAVDITGDVSGATKGEAALRAEATAGRAAETSVASVAKAMGSVGSAVKGVQAGAAAVRDLGKAAKGAMSDLDALAKATEKRQGSRASRSAAALMGKAGVPAAAMPKLGPGLAAPHEDSNTSSRWAKAASSTTPAVKGAASASSAGGAAATSAKAATGAFAGVGGAIKGAAVALLAYEAGLAGLHSLSDLTRIAVGWRTMGQLQLISWRATMDLRRAVAGVDAKPLVRAATDLERNLSKPTVTGSALSGVLTRGYNAFFQAVERLEPALSRAMQVGVLGALELEDAWLRTQITLFPVSAAIEEATKNTSLLGHAASDAEDVFRGIGTIVDGIASGLAAAGNAIIALQKRVNYGNLPEEEQIRLGNADRERAAQAARDAANPGRHEVYTSEDGAKPTRNAGQEILDDTERRAAAIAAGKDTARGLAEGLDAGAPAVRAAGARAGQGAIDGARSATDTHSPSRKAIAVGRDIGAGEVIGLDSKARDIQAAADRSMSPEMPGASSGGGRSGGGSITIQSLQVGPFEVHGGGDDLEAKLLAMAPRLAQEILRILSMRAGLAVPST